MAGTTTRRIALFGGSFNPPHLGHEALLATLLEHELADEVWVVPVFEHPFGKALAPFADRLAMCRLAFARFGSRVQVSDIERELGGPSYTVRTLETLHARMPDHVLELVVGADTLKDTRNWRDFARVRELARLLVIPRQGEDSGSALDLPQPPGVSSSEVRRRLAAGESVEGMLSSDVASYATAHGLYRAEGPGTNGNANPTEG